MIKERLMALPYELEQKKLEILQMQEELRMHKEYVATRELEMSESIANETDRNGKKAFSNDMMRKAELERQKQLELIKNNEYADAVNGISKVEPAIALQNIQLETLLNEQSNLRAICRLEGASDD